MVFGKDSRRNRGNQGSGPEEIESSFGREKR